MGPGPWDRLAAVEAALGSAPEPGPGDSLRVVEQWLAASSARLGRVGVAEAGLLAYCQLQVQLMMGGPLAQREDGTNRPHRERLELARSLQARVCDALEVARRRLLERVGVLEQVAEAGIRAAAEARLLAAPDGRPRTVWLAEMAMRMADHPHSAPHLARLALCSAEHELRAVLDRVFVRAFGV